MSLVVSTATTPGDGETLDELLRGRIRILQQRRGARVSADSLLLADFAGLPGRARRILDLGCGTGVVGLVLAAQAVDSEIVGVELQPDIAALARRNALLNGVDRRMSVIGGDLRRAAALPLEAASFDLVVANPPYRIAGQGRPPAGDARAVARHELACALDDVIAAARRFTRPRGRVAVVLPAERLVELTSALDAAGLRPRRIRAVHSVAKEPARRVLVEGVRGYRGGVEVLAPLIVHGADRRGFTPEAAAILEGRDKLVLE